MLNPGLVGLSILDSFACGVPLITTDCGIHSPEIAYLENWANGVITTNLLDQYVDAVMSVLTKPSKLCELQRGCAKAASKYTLGHMVTRFMDGIVSATS
jgi:glycosyltransferase involved in cell wall biosynthesis